MSTEKTIDHADTCGPANVEKVTPAFGQWQPIETAPITKAEAVLVWNGRRVRVAFFCGVEEYDNEQPYWWAAGYHEAPLSPQPTHWMPLPNAPDSDDRTVIQNGGVNQSISKALGTPVSGGSHGE